MSLDNFAESALNSIECMICLQEGILTDYGCPSKHIAHKACIDPWLKNNSDCPYCRQTISSESNRLDSFLNYSKENKYFFIGDFIFEEFFSYDVIQQFNEFSINFQKKCFEKDEAFFRYINEKTPELCLAAVKRSDGALQFVPEPMKTAKICLIAVRQNGHALRFVPHHLKTSKICIAAVRSTWRALEYVPRTMKTLKLRFIAIIQDRRAFSLFF
ncbi:MAG: DUF4116 domain-containing protein [Patescibacteria group bacterium]